MQLPRRRSRVITLGVLLWPQVLMGSATRYIRGRPDLSRCCHLDTNGAPSWEPLCHPIGFLSTNVYLLRKLRDKNSRLSSFTSSLNELDVIIVTHDDLGRKTSMIFFFFNHGAIRSLESSQSASASNVEPITFRSDDSPIDLNVLSGRVVFTSADTDNEFMLPSCGQSASLQLLAARYKWIIHLAGSHIYRI